MLGQGLTHYIKTQVESRRFAQSYNLPRPLALIRCGIPRYPQYLPSRAGSLGSDTWILWWLIWPCTTSR
ncbi:hypothetical protein ACS0TY_018250 [Phlomoides rotata]